MSRKPLYGCVTALAILAFLLAGIGHSEVVAAQSETNAISGRWDATFEAQANQIAGEMILKADGERLEGAMYTDHTGAGTLSNGSYKDGKLAFRAEFVTHPPVEITGTLQNGELTGEYRVEGMAGKWRARRHWEN